MQQMDTKPSARSAAGSSAPASKKRRVRRAKRRKWPIVVCIILVVLVIAGSVTRNILRQDMEFLQNLIEESAFFQNSSLGRHLLSALTGLPINTYDQTVFQPTEDGRITYASSQVQTLQGIDVSSYQGEIDWEQVAGDGIGFAIIRIAFRGYGDEGNLHVDAQFEANIQGALDAGIPVGVYIFSQAITVEEAVEEANFVLDNLGDYDIQYPIVFDWEPFSKQEARTDGLSARELTACCVAFCETIEAAGYRPMVYFNPSIGLNQYYLPDIAQYDFWLAQYNAVPTFFAAFQIWQYSDSGQVDGISGPVDLNLSFVDYAAS